MERALEVERARHASEMERALEAEWAQQASEIEEHSRVSGHDKSHKWMRSWRHGLKLCPILAKWSHCSASRYPCSESLMITQRQTKIMHIIWMWYRLLITNQIIINGFFFFVVWLHLFKFTRCSMIRSYCLLTIFVLSFTAPTENVVKLPDHENLDHDWYWVTFWFILVGEYILAFFVLVL